MAQYLMILGVYTIQISTTQQMPSQSTQMQQISWGNFATTVSSPVKQKNFSNNGLIGITQIFKKK